MRYGPVALVFFCCALPVAAATYTVTNNAGSGPGSLSQAIQNANLNPGLDTIVFAIGSGPQTIQWDSTSIGNINDPVIIDGTTQPGFAGTPIITIDGGNHVRNDGLDIGTSGCTIRGLAIGGFSGGVGISIFGDSNVIEGNFLGIDATGSVARPNEDGVNIIKGANNRIGGTTAASRNVLSGNSQNGVDLTLLPIPNTAITGTLIEGNYIGTNAAGTAALANANQGIKLSGATGTIISGNVVSASLFFGISIDGAGTSGTTITGNLIGTDATGSAAIPNAFVGISITNGAPGTVIGGTTAAARNVISGNTNGSGISINGTATGTLIEGNFIGIDATGTAALPNTIGISLSQTTGQVIGGTAAGAGNVISGNSFGIALDPGTSGTVITGNLIGTNATGTAAVGNREGIQTFVSAGNGVTNTTIGGTASGSRNVISGNTDNGIVLGGATGGLIQGNYIGLDVTGSAAVGNVQAGVATSGGSNILIGGTTAAARNVISANGNGIVASAGGPLIQGNFIGTDAAGMANLGNTTAGIYLTNVASNVQIGGTAAGAANTIWFNRKGVVVAAGSGNAIQHNSITSSTTGLGIDLGDDGVTPNHAGGALPNFPNNLQNYPVLTSALLGSGSTTVSGTLNSDASKTFTIELFDNPACSAAGFGEGKTFVTSTIVTTDANGNASFSVPVPFAMTVVTATATDSGGNTSEFSKCVIASPSTLSINDVQVTEPLSGTATATFTVTRNPAISMTSTVQWSTADGTAVAVEDYVAASGTLTFNPGDTTKTISIVVPGDNVDELTETFFVNLTNATAATIMRTPGTGTILNTDRATATIHDAPPVFEGQPAVFTVTLSNPADHNVTFAFSTADGTAKAGRDYTATSGNLTFAPFQTSKTISIPTLMDPAFLEPNETFTVTITGQAIAGGTATATIQDAAFIPALSPWLLLMLAGVLAMIGCLLLARR